MTDVKELADRPAKKEREIEVTSEMIEAGIDAYRPFWCELRDLDEGSDAKMVESVFIAKMMSMAEK